MNTHTRIAIVLLFTVPLSGAETRSQWRQSDFIIGSHEDPCISDNINPHPADSAHSAKLNSDRYNYQFCKNAYFNMTTGHNHLWDERPCDTPVLHGQEKTDYSLQVAADVGLKSLVQHEPWGSCNCNAAFLPFMRTENTTPYHSHRNYAAYISHHYKSLGAGQYAALQGYFVAAEPGPGQTNVSCGSDGFSHGIDTLKMWVNAFKTYAPEKQSHVFIFPSGGVLLGTFADSTSYKDYIDTVFNDVDSGKRPQVVCSNSYPLFDPGVRPIEQNFFWALTTYRIKAWNRPFWNYVHCVFTYRDGDAGRDPKRRTYIPPDEATLRWNAFTNVAHGAKGLIWFTYWSVNNYFGVVGNYGDAIVDCHNKSPLISGSNPRRTEYTVIQEINRYLTCIVGPMVMTSNFVNAYHKKISGPDAGGNYSVIPGQSHIPAHQILSVGANDPVLYDLSNKNVMAGVFQDKVNTKTCSILLVNKNWALNARPITNLSVVLKGDQTGNVFLAPRSYGYNGSTGFTQPTVMYNSADQLSTTIIPELKSGEGRLIKIIGTDSGTLRHGFRPQGEIAVAQNAIDKKLICFARGMDNRIYARIQDTANVDFWGSEWNLVNPTLVGGNIVCANFGRHYPITIASTTIDGKLQYSFQSRPLDKKNPLLFERWRTCAMAQKINGPITCSNFGSSREHLAFFFRCGYSLHYAYLDRSGVCHGPFPVTQVATGISGGFGLGLNGKSTAACGSIDLFVTKSNNRLYRGRMSVSDLLRHNVPPFSDFGCNAAGEIAVGANADNTLEVFFVKEGSNNLSHKRQHAPGSAEWDAYDEPVHVYAALSVGRNSDGRLELFTKDSTGHLCHLWQHAANRPLLSTIMPLGAGPITAGTTAIAIGNNGDGRLAIFSACACNSNIFFTSQGRTGCGIDWQNCLPFTNLSDQDR